MNTTKVCICRAYDERSCDCINFLQETIKVLMENGKSAQDVLWVQKEKEGITWMAFHNASDFFYDSGYGTNIIHLELKIVGKDWWLERYEYDGAERWVFKKFPSEPEFLKLEATHEWFKDPYGLETEKGALIEAEMNLRCNNNTCNHSAHIDASTSGFISITKWNEK